MNCVEAWCGSVLRRLQVLEPPPPLTHVHFLSRHQLLVLPQVTTRLDTHPAMITVLKMGAARHFLRMQQLAKTQEERAQLLQPTLEINTG